MTLWRVPGAPVLLILGLIARVGISMEPLGLLLLVQETTGRYAPAALAVAVYTLAYAVVSPFAGRVASRIGVAVVLLTMAVLAHPVCLVVLILVAGAAEPPMASIVVAAALAGATYPPLVAVLRSAWTGLTEPDSGRFHLRGTALAADTALYQCIFVVGPLLVAGLVAIFSPTMVLAASAAVTALGTLGLARGQAVLAMPRRAPQTHGDRLGPLRSSGFRALLCCAAGLGLAFGVITVAVPAFVTAHGHDSGALAGVLLAVLGTGSVLGGFWYGATRFRAALPQQFTVLLVGVAAAYAVYAAMPHPVALAAALFVGGALVAPVLVVENALVGRLIPAGTRTEAYTWVVCVEVTASSAGFQLAGMIVDRAAGVPWAFLTASLGLVCAAVVAGLPSGPIARAAREAVAEPAAR